MGLYELEEYDHLYVTVRRDKLKELEFCYEQFGWEEVERQEHTVYENLLDMTFRRPHKIADKDELQLLQVHLEEALNAVGKYEKAPKRKTKAFSICLGVLAFLLIAFGLPLGIVPVTVAYKVIGYIMAAVGIIIVPLVCVFGVKLWHYENTTYERRLRMARNLVIAVCHSAMEVRSKGAAVLAEIVEPTKEIVSRIASEAPTEEAGEEMFVDIMDANIRRAIEERSAYAKEHEEAEAADAAAGAAADAREAEILAANSVVVIPEGDHVIIMEPSAAGPAAGSGKDAGKEDIYGAEAGSIEAKPGAEPAKEAGDE